MADATIIRPRAAIIGRRSPLFNPGYTPRNQWMLLTQDGKALTTQNGKALISQQRAST